VHTWAQTIRLSPNARPYFLSNEELIWANPKLAGKIPNTPLKAFLYFRKLLQAESPDHLKFLTQTSSIHDPRTTPIANRWHTIQATSLTNVPPRPTPLRLHLSSKQLDITTNMERRAALITQTHLTIPRPPPIHVNINSQPNKRTKTKRTHNTSSIPIPSPQSHNNLNLTHQTPVARILQQGPKKHPRRSTRPSRTTPYLVEWCPLTCPFHVAKAHLDKGIPITHIHISPLFATDRPLTPEDLDPRASDAT